MAKEIFNIDKDENFSEWYTEILKKAEIVDVRYPVKGFPVYQPYGFGIMRAMFRELEDRLDALNFQATYFPLLVAESALRKEEEHAEGFKAEVFWIEKAKDSEEERLAIRPTSETIMYPMFAKWMRSYADLPIKVHQTTTLYRFETKATRPLFRGREVYWNEAHAAHATYDETEKDVVNVTKMYKALFENFLGIHTLVLKRPDWDKFKGGHYTIAFDAMMPDGKNLQIGTTHHLGDGFSKAYNVTYTDSTGKEAYPHMSSYGIAMRATGGMLAVHGDNKGLVLPFNSAPVQVAVIPVLFGKGKDEKVMKAVSKITSQLQKQGIKFKVDASDKRAGEKFYYWEMRGVPFRVEIGPKDVEKDQAVIVRRDTNDKLTVKTSKVLDTIIKTAENQLRDLSNASQQKLEASIHTANTLNVLKDILKKKGGFVKVPYCSLDMSGESCADVIKDETHADVRGELYLEKEEPKNAKCVVCGKDAKHLAYVSKSY